LYELTLPFSCEPYFFIGKKPTAVHFGNECIEVKSWSQVFAVLLDRCNLQYHDRLMYLRDKVSGKVRIFLFAKPDGMVNPVKIDEELYAQRGQYGAATLIHILRDLILYPAGFDCTDISITLK
jgi:hypothetical protein